MNTLNIHQQASEFKFFLGEQSHDLLADNFTLAECLAIFVAACLISDAHDDLQADLYTWDEESMTALLGKLPKDIACNLDKLYA